MIDNDKLARAALGGILAALDTDGAGANAAELLSRLLGAGAPLPAIAAAAPVAHRDTKPANVTRPKRSAKKAKRRAPDGRSRPLPKTPPNEQARLVAELLERHGGTLTDVGLRYGFAPMHLGRMLRGGSCSPSSLERLRIAVAEGNRPPKARGRRADVDQADAGEGATSAAPNEAAGECGRPGGDQDEADEAA
jgi:hypothetical protein